MRQPQFSAFFAICSYILGVLTYGNILQKQGEGSVHIQENWMSEQGSLDFSPSTRLISGFFAPVFFFPH